jgi:hypothetical protein
MSRLTVSKGLRKVLQLNTEKFLNLALSKQGIGEESHDLCTQDGWCIVLPLTEIGREEGRDRRHLCSVLC